jgi:hypothetical protein
MDDILLDYKYSLCKNDTNILCYTSLLFLVPTIYAFENGLYIYSLFVLLMGLFSMNFWRKPKYGLRRNCDIVYANFAFYTSIIIFIIYVTNIFYIILSLINLSIIIYTFTSSGYYFRLNNHKWLVHHTIFHFCMVVQQMILVYHIINTKS